MANTSSPAADPLWLAHRYDAAADTIQFVHVTRAQHRAATFLTDEYLPQAKSPRVLTRPGAVQQAAPAAPVHFLFHSAFCCSTLFARALDREGVAMGLSEPVILNDIVGWRHREELTAQVIAQRLDQSLLLLSRPFQNGESVVIKPSNLVNVLAPALLALRPEARAILMHAPLDAFLGSIARKGLWGRLWIRELYVKLLREDLAVFGLSVAERLQLSDIQVAAVCWLAQHKLFNELVVRFGSARVRTLDSDELMQRPADALAAAAALFGLPLDDGAISDIVAGPAFTRHSKSGGQFSPAERAAEREAGLKAHADEVEKVAIWARRLAEVNRISLTLPAPLLD